MNPFKFKILPLIEPLIEPQTSDLHQIARAKVRQAYRQTETPVVAQNSGFFLHGWNGFPGPFVKFALKTIGLTGLLKLVKLGPRECEFRSSWTYLDNTLKRPIFLKTKLLKRRQTLPEVN